MVLPPNKTKIVCTIGPASESQEVLERMIRAGMCVARLNFSHGDFASHGKAIENLRAASMSAGKRVTVMADLSGPKIRLGEVDPEPVELKPGSPFSLTTEEIVGDTERVSVNSSRLTQVVRPGDTIFLNDGYIQLEVIRVRADDVHCRVVVGGELRSRKGLNLPGVDLGISAFTERDHRCLEFALENGVDAVSQSFVERASDIHAVRNAAREFGGHPFIIAKIERSKALKHMDEILEAADGIMIARGDLGVEMPIEEMPVVQKDLTREANLLGKPVITATQMLESMKNNRRPTRAEATDVANAVLDGTDCVMLSEESATGSYPVEAVTMLSRIAAAVEPRRPAPSAREAITLARSDTPLEFHDLIALSVETTLQHVSPAAVIVPTRSGASARSIARFRLPVWIIAVSALDATCRNLQFSYGVHPVHVHEHPADWKDFARDWLHQHGVVGDLVVLAEGPSTKHPEGNHRMEIIDLRVSSNKDG